MGNLGRKSQSNYEKILYSDSTRKIMTDYPIVIGDEALSSLATNLHREAYDRIMVLADTHTFQDCYPLLQPHLPLHDIQVIEPGEKYKNLATCEILWESLTNNSMDRSGLIINLGGGVLGDMGGFVAATYKRGIAFIQVPTTLLAQVDASVGGKLGIDFHNFKNHIGIFQNPRGVYIYPKFLQTLPPNELTSGFAEIIKHHLIADKTGWESLKTQTELPKLAFDELIEHSIEIKRKLVELDPTEKGPRKALNFGHTLGHAIESLYLDRADLPTLLHGEAIAIGMIGEAYIAMQRSLLDHSDLQEITQYIRAFFPLHPIEELYFEEIYRRMKQDKKNKGGEILCTLLNGIGQYKVNQSLEEGEIRAALRYYSKGAIGTPN